MITACALLLLGLNACTFYDSSEPLTPEETASVSSSDEESSSSGEIVESSSSDEKVESSSSDETENPSSSSKNVEGMENFDSDLMVFTDPRDNMEYNVVEIDGTLWFVKNMMREIKGATYYNEGDEDGTENREKFGYLYFPNQLADVCPVGSHVSTVDEWEGMIGDDDNKWEDFAKKLTSKDFGFKALLGGEYSEESYSGLNTSSSWAALDGSDVFMYQVSETSIYKWPINERDEDMYALYVRCVVDTFD